MPKNPGKDALGHGPFSKVKLEGPKKHHDDHGPNASVPAKGNKPAIPKEHWEIHYPPSEASQNMYLTKGSDFIPKRPKDRKTTHLKINETDH